MVEMTLKFGHLEELGLTTLLIQKRKQANNMSESWHSIAVLTSKYPESSSYCSIWPAGTPGGHQQLWVRR
jgi:hypothetical protein